MVHDGSGHDTTAWTEGGLSGSPVVPLERKKRKRQSVDCDVPASTKRDDLHASEERGEAGVRRPTPPQVAAPTIGRSGWAMWKSGIKFLDHVEFKYDGDIPLSYASAECAELIRQMRGGPRDMPPLSDLFFKDAYVNAARTKVLL